MPTQTATGQAAFQHELVTHCADSRTSARTTPPHSPVAVAMSGGVDSSVAAALLVESGRDVFGVTMSLGPARTALPAVCEETACGLMEAPSASKAASANGTAHSSAVVGNNKATSSRLDFDDPVMAAENVCRQLGIPHVVINLAKEFDQMVVEPFCASYAAGRTPNPCVWCNERIKFGILAEQASRLGAARLATGHYARVVCEQEGSDLEITGCTAWLERGRDASKDQSYFLYRVSPRVLAMLEFPLGDLTKARVRLMARERGLPAAERLESQEVCFTHNHVQLVGTRYPTALTPGPIVDRTGRTLGTHRGIARYTVGQRKGLGIASPAGPCRVVRIDAQRNTLVVEYAETPPSCTSVTLEDSYWRLSGPAPVLAQARYRGAPRSAWADPRPEGLTITFDQPVFPLAPGQSLVLYQDARVVGGGFVPAVDAAQSTP